jgi:uncharacterized UBP type Zn finger protein
MTPIEKIERKMEQANKHKIMDQQFLAMEAEARSARDAKSAKNYSMGFTWNIDSGNCCCGNSIIYIVVSIKRSIFSIYYEVTKST